VSPRRWLARRRGREAALDAELRDHFEREVAARMQAGASEAEARRATRLAFGGVEQVKEAVRDVRPGLWLEQLGQDLRHGARALSRSPGFTATVVLTLALGIGANTAIFQLVNAVLLRPLPVPEPGRLALFFDGAQGCARRLGTPTGPPGRRLVYSYPLYQRLRAEGRSFTGIAAQEGCATASVVVGPEAAADRGRGAGGSARADGRAVSANYFDVLGVRAHLGRTFTAADETAPGQDQVLVVSHGYWQRRFGGDPGVVGGRVSVNGAPYTLVGVAAPGFSGAETGSRTDFWVPVTMQEALTRLGLRLGDRNYSSLVLLGRLRAGVSLRAAEAEADLAYHRWLAEDPGDAGREAREPTRLMLDPGATGRFPLRDTLRDTLLALLAAVGLLLLIVCLNVSHLLLARSLRRRHELSVRVALGASRGRLMRQLAAEGALLALLGAGLGLAVASALSDGLLAVAENGGWEQPLALEVGLDVRVWLFTAAVTALVGLLVGLVPAWRASRPDLQPALRASSSSLTGDSGARPLASRALLTSQVAASLVLLVAAGLLTGSLIRLRGVRTGFDVAHTLLVDLNGQVTGMDESQALRLYQELQRRAEAVPGVRSASLALAAPLAGGGGITTQVYTGAGQHRGAILLDLVTPGYFETLGMGIGWGRAFTAADRAGGPVGILSQQLARKLFGSEQAALGARYRLHDGHGPEAEVVGVVRDATSVTLRKQGSHTVYQLAGQPHGLPVNLFLGSLQVRAEGDPGPLAAAVRAALREARPDLPVLAVRTMRGQMDRFLVRERLLATLSAAIGAGALFLVCIGLYGVIAQWAALRTREIGLRMALGATAGGVRRLVLRQGLRLVAAGVALGLPLAAAAAWTLRRFLFGVAPLDPATLAGAAVVLVAVTLAAAFLPARRAARIDPMRALRGE
jgi:predicted permease